VNNDNCFQSANYPDNYEKSKTCTITVNDIGRLNVVDFDIQENSPCSYDYLTVGGKKYCGTTGPRDAKINSGDTITWSSNSGFAKTGFKICYEAPFSNCIVTNGSMANTNGCVCGTTECTDSTGLFCDVSSNNCSTGPPCSITDGRTANSNACTCGTTGCTTSTGLFCKSNFCAPVAFGSDPIPDYGTYDDGSNRSCGIRAAVDTYTEDATISKYGHIVDWNVSGITDMSHLFSDKRNFNSDLSNWKTQNVIKMNDMFYGCKNFNRICRSGSLKRSLQ
jgi:hypothetical protein